MSTPNCLAMLTTFWVPTRWIRSVKATGVAITTTSQGVRLIVSSSSCRWMSPYPMAGSSVVMCEYYSNVERIEPTAYGRHHQLRGARLPCRHHACSVRIFAVRERRCHLRPPARASANLRWIVDRHVAPVFDHPRAGVGQFDVPANRGHVLRGGSVSHPVDYHHLRPPQIHLPQDSRPVHGPAGADPRPRSPGPKRRTECRCCRHTHRITSASFSAWRRIFS